VRRRLGLLTNSGMLVFRTDFARVEAGWPTALALKLSVTGSAVTAVGRTLVRYPETRFCVAVIGAERQTYSSRCNSTTYPTSTR